jgi:hypothetical protein
MYQINKGRLIRLHDPMHISKLCIKKLAQLLATSTSTLFPSTYTCISSWWTCTNKSSQVLFSPELINFNTRY